MSAIGPFAVPILAVGAFAATLGWFGYQHMTPSPNGKSQSAVTDSTKKPAATDGGATAPRDGAKQDGRKASPGGTPRASETPAPAPIHVAAASDAAPQVAGSAPGAPAFDVVRVEPTGETVVAGRASPGASVELVLNGIRQTRVVADPSGLFALVPEPLPPGSHELVLQVTNADGAKIRSPQSVTVVVAANKKDPPLVTITAPGQPAVVLSRPDGATSTAGAKPAEGGKQPAEEKRPAGTAQAEGAKPAAEPAPASKTRRAVQIVSVETEGAGRLLVSGSASPAAVVRLYLNDTFIAPASASTDGRVSFAIERGMQPGSYKVRLDDVDAVSGQVRSRAEVPFEMPQQVAGGNPPDGKSPAGGAEAEGRSTLDAPPGRLASASGETRPAPSAVVPEVSTTLVSRGDSLWAISKRAYGHGLRYSVIYGANAKQIRDPDLIYPGQLFVLPADGKARAAH